MFVSPLAVVAATVGVVCFVRGFRRLRARRLEYAGWDRVTLFALAVGAGLFAMSAPLDDRAADSLAAHMLQHVLIGDAVPALALVAVRGPLLLFVVPEFLLRAVSGSATARSALSTLTRPVVAFGLWAGTLAFWHLPSVYDATLSTEPLHVIEHAAFFLTGTLAWIQIVDPARRGSLGTVGRLSFLLGMFVVGQLLATTLVLAPSPIYEPYAEGARLLDLSPLADQDAAGLTMMVEQLLALGLAAAFLLRRHLDEESSQASIAEAPAHPFLA